MALWQRAPCASAQLQSTETMYIRAFRHVYKRQNAEALMQDQRCDGNLGISLGLPELYLYFGLLGFYMRVYPDEQGTQLQSGRTCVPEACTYRRHAQENCAHGRLRWHVNRQDQMAGLTRNMSTTTWLSSAGEIQTYQQQEALCVACHEASSTDSSWHEALVLPSVRLTGNLMKLPSKAHDSK